MVSFVAFMMALWPFAAALSPLLIPSYAIPPCLAESLWRGNAQTESFVRNNNNVSREFLQGCAPIEEVFRNCARLSLIFSVTMPR
jgi:hypothetical protein